MPDRTHSEDRSDKGFPADAAPRIVMAEQITHDVVKEAQSMGGPSLIDDPATTTNNSAGDGEASSEPTTADPNPSEAFPTTSTNATSTDATQVDGIQASEKAGGDAVTVS